MMFRKKDSGRPWWWWRCETEKTREVPSRIYVSLCVFFPATRFSHCRPLACSFNTLVFWFRSLLSLILRIFFLFFFLEGGGEVRLGVFLFPLGKRMGVTWTLLRNSKCKVRKAFETEQRRRFPNMKVVLTRLLLSAAGFRVWVFFFLASAFLLVRWVPNSARLIRKTKEQQRPRRKREQKKNNVDCASFSQHFQTEQSWDGLRLRFRASFFLFYGYEEYYFGVYAFSRKEAKFGS